MNQIKLTAELLAEGWSSAELERMARSGELQRIRRGAYEFAPARSLERRDQHRRLIAATLRLTSVDSVISHISAAVLHHLPIWSDQLEKVHVTRNQAGGGKIRRYVHLHAAPLTEIDICEIDCQRVTTLGRTVLDLLRTLSMERSVPIGDAALRLGLTVEELAEIAGRCIGWRGMLQARRAMNFLDARSESAGESYSRVLLDRIGIPAPIPQYEVWRRGLLVGRADFGWEEFRTLGEFDGKEKYGKLLRPGQTAADAVFEEKRREDALRDLGWQIVRWMWADLYHPAELRQRLQRAFDRGLRAA
jgi:putative AbiEi antitoxin of type IV toxin-antitoxin system